MRRWKPCSPCGSGWTPAKAYKLPGTARQMFGTTLETAATANMTFPHPKPDTQPSMVKKIGKTTYLPTYLVWAHFSETGTETTEDKIKRMLRLEVRQMMAQE